MGGFPPGIPMVQSGCAVCYPKWMVPRCSLSPHYVHGLSVFPFCAYINYRLRRQQSSPNCSHFTRTVQTKMRVPGARLASIRRDASCRRYFGPRWSHHRKRLVPQTASHPDTRLGTTHISRKRTGYTLPDIPQIEPPFLDIAPAGMLPTIISHSKGVKCVLIRSNSSFHGPTTVLPSVKSPNRLSTTKSLPWEALLPCTTR